MSRALAMGRDDHDALLRLAAGCGAPEDLDRVAALVDGAATGDGGVALGEHELAALAALVRAWRAAPGTPAPGAEVVREIAHRWRRGHVPAAPGQERIGPRSWLSRDLGAAARRDLAWACDVVVADAFAALGGGPAREAFMARLPPRPYPGDFLPRFVAVLVQTAGRLAQPERPAPCCIAEEVALHLLVTEARRLAEDAGHEGPAREIAEHAWWDDTDFAVLWSPPGRPDPFPELRTGTAPDTPAGAWFRPYDAARGEVHPFAADDEAPPA